MAQLLGQININPDNIDDYIELIRDNLDLIENNITTHENNINSLSNAKKDYLRTKHLKDYLKNRPAINENILIGTIFFIKEEEKEG